MQLKQKSKTALFLSLLLFPQFAYSAVCKKGKASWYGNQFHGKKTASGSIFNENHLTTAHKKLPFGTKLLVKNEKSGASIIVTVTDRGPFIKGRDLDLSKAAMRKLGGLKSGVINIKYCQIRRT